MIFLYFILSLITLASGEPRFVEPPTRVELPPPPAAQGSSARNVFESWITMPIDHFDPQNQDTYQMRFMFNEQFFGGDGYPVFILVGGEWDIASGWLLGGNMFAMAQENRGYQIYTEHRYYGQSLPFQEFTTENLRFLNIDQALADLAFFIKEMKKQPRFANSKVILYGGSYAANMVLWFKQRYPHLALGTVASSGPIKAQVDFYGYLEVVHNAFLSEGGEQCIGTIRQGIQDTIEALATEEGRRRIESAYRFCGPMNYDNKYDLGYFSGLITWTFSGSVQQARPGTLTTICNNFAGTVYARAWCYQTCTEYGYFQTVPRSGTAFDDLIWNDLDLYIEVCKRVYDARFDEKFVYDAAERVNLMFGALEPVVNKTINIHGNIDPWRALGVYDRDLKEGSPTFSVPRASHCFDMQNWLPTDTIQMTNVQQAARRMVQSWLSE